MLAAQGILTYCANGRTTVPMYADAARLLVFEAFLTSASCIKKYFFDATEPESESLSGCFLLNHI